MWVIDGPFDEEHSAESQAPEKRKLLKTGKNYGLGRREQLLQIKNKAISKNHALFTVGECSEQQAADPHFIPTLTFHNLTDRVRPIERPSLTHPRVLCQGQSTMELESGDIVHLSATVYVTVHWEEICCYYAPAKGGSQISVKECASLGIHALSTSHPSVTHHLTPNYTLDAALATSLISVATLVKPEWLTALLASARAPAGELSSLEESYALPSTSKYRPAFSPTLPSRFRKTNLWELNEERVGMFRSCRFIFVGEKGAETQGAMTELVKRGEGEYECLSADKGRDGLNQVLAKGKARGARLVLVADLGGVQAAVGRDGLGALVEEAKSFELKFIPPLKVVEAVVNVDISHIDCTSTGEELQESILPDVVPNTIEDEPSVVNTNRRIEPEPGTTPNPEPVTEAPPAAPKRKLTRRAASRASSRAPSLPPAAPEENPAPPAVPEEAAVPEPPAPRRTLVRRAARPKAIIDDEGSMEIDTTSGRASMEPPGSQEPARRAESVIPPTPVRPSRLKRRIGTQAQSATPTTGLFTEDVFIPSADEPEPEYKKYKSLFDSYDPDKIAQMSAAEYGSQLGGGESVTQYEPSGPVTLMRTRSQGPRTAGRAGGMLGAVMEEESLGEMGTQTQARGTKRKPQDEDVEMGDEAPPKSRRRTGDENGTESQTLAQTQANTHTETQIKKPISKTVTRIDMAQSQVYVKPRATAASKSKTTTRDSPDRDDAFLKAVASTKRGKKAEDEFDREFNNLRISKPDLEREREDAALKVLEDFGDDGDVRGNFMVVVEMPVFRSLEESEGSSDLRRRARGEGRLEWQGRQDFKKFRRKALGERRQPIELLVEEDNDLGIGSQYWKSSSQAPPPSQSKSLPRSQPGKSTTTTQKSTQRSTKDRPSLVSSSASSEDEKPVVRASRGKSQSKSQTPKPPSAQPLSKTGSRTRGKTSEKQPLFIDSDIEEEEDNSLRAVEKAVYGDEDDDPAATLRSTGRSTQGTARTKSGGAARKRAPAIVVDDDSDDGATFKAFGARSRTKRR